MTEYERELRALARVDGMQQQAEENIAAGEWYRLNSALGHTWARYYVIAGGRETGKSYAGAEFVLRQWRQRRRRFFWIRLSEVSKNKLLANNCAQLFNAALRREFKLDTCRVGNKVYEVLKRDEKGKIVKKAWMGTVMALSEMSKDKGVEYYDHGYKGWINIIVDELVREKQERKTFDVNYNLGNQLENILRSKRDRYRIICFCNMCGEIAEVFPKWNFIPIEYGRFKIRRWKAVIDYLPVTETYKKRREYAAANLMLSSEDGNFNNRQNRDMSRIWDKPVKKPTAIIKFSVDKIDWFVVWDGKVISRYKGENIKNIIAMRRHINETFIPEERDDVLSLYDVRHYWYKDPISQDLFINRMKEIKIQ